jgi:hypothetical protein
LTLFQRTACLCKLDPRLTRNRTFKKESISAIATAIPESGVRVKHRHVQFVVLVYARKPGCYFDCFNDSGCFALLGRRSLKRLSVNGPING